ncbi:MAG: signal peptidase I [Candidatus Paceibacterota bacterium]
MEKENKLVEKTQTKKESFWEIFRFALIAVAIVIPIRIFIAQPFIVSGSSMVPTFQDGQYLIVDEISYRLGEIKRDDVVIFRYPKDIKKFFIKRIIGLPNETVKISGSDVTIINKEHPEGLQLEQPYVENKSDNEMEYELGDEEYFVMGDNRTGSSDSRYWGSVPKNLIIGRAFIRLLPITKIGIMPGNYKQVEPTQ